MYKRALCMMFAAALNRSVSSDDGSLVVILDTAAGRADRGAADVCPINVFQWAMFKKTEYDVKSDLKTVTSIIAGKQKQQTEILKCRKLWSFVPRIHVCVCSENFKDSFIRFMVIVWSSLASVFGGLTG